MRIVFTWLLLLMPLLLFFAMRPKPDLVQPHCRVEDSLRHDPKPVVKSCDNAFHHPAKKTGR